MSLPPASVDLKRIRYARAALDRIIPRAGADGERSEKIARPRDVEARAGDRGRRDREVHRIGARRIVHFEHVAIGPGIGHDEARLQQGRVLIAAEHHGVVAGPERDRHGTRRIRRERLHASRRAVEIQIAREAGVAGGEAIVTEQSVHRTDDQRVAAGIAGKGRRHAGQCRHIGWGDAAFQALRT